MRNLWAIAAGLLVGCAGAAGNGPDLARLCDGSAALKVGVAVVGGGQLPPGERVMVENGFAYLYVDGACRYWVQPGASRWAEARAGTLDAAAAAQLSADLALPRWPSWSGAHWSAPAFDASTSVFFAAGAQWSCTSCAEAASAPDEARQLAARWTTTARALWDRGAPIDGAGVRITVVALDPGTYASVARFAWPLASPLAGLALDPGAAGRLEPGSGLSITGADAEALKALRRQYQAGPYERNGVYGIPVEEGGQSALLFLRDALPFEDARGLVHPPAP